MRDDKKQKIKFINCRCSIVIFTVDVFSSTFLPSSSMIILALYVVVLFSLATRSLEELVKNSNDELRGVYSRASFKDDNSDSIAIMRSVNHPSKKNVKTQRLRSGLLPKL